MREHLARRLARVPFGDKRQDPGAGVLIKEHQQERQSDTEVVREVSAHCANPAPVGPSRKRAHPHVVLGDSSSRGSSLSPRRVMPVHSSKGLAVTLRWLGHCSTLRRG